MKDYTIQEMPNIDDADLIKNCVSVQSMRCTLSALLCHVISQLTVTPFTVQIRVALSIMKRLAEGALSIELLCQKNRVRDAAILLLNVHELRLDLQYIARDPRRANIWLDHTEEHRKPWRVAEQMAEIFGDYVGQCRRGVTCRPRRCSGRSVCPDSRAHSKSG